jgi:hypothetical protein
MSFIVTFIAELSHDSDHEGSISDGGQVLLGAELVHYKHESVSHARIGALGFGDAAAQADTTWKETQAIEPEVENPAAASGTPESNSTGERPLWRRSL